MNTHHLGSKPDGWPQGARMPNLGGTQEKAHDTGWFSIPTRTCLAAILVVSCGPIAMAMAQKLSVALSHQQQRTVLQEAVELHRRSQTADRTLAQDLLTLAIDKYQLVVESELRSPRLYANLADAYLAKGQLVFAIANFEQAHRLAPHDTTIERRLREARQKFDVDPAAITTDLSLPRAWRALTELTLRIPLVWSRWTALASWSLFWLICCVQTTRRPFAILRIVGGVSLCCFLMSCVLVGGRRIHDASYNGIAIGEEVTMYAGDGETFSRVGSLQPAQRIRIDDRREQWLKVTADQRSGWVRDVHVFSLAD